MGWEIFNIKSVDLVSMLLIKTILTLKIDQF